MTIKDIFIYVLLGWAVASTIAAFGKLDRTYESVESMRSVEPQRRYYSA